MNRFYGISCTLMTICLVVVSQTALSFGESAPYQRLKGPVADRQQSNFYNIPKLSNKNKLNQRQKRAFSLFGSGKIDLDTAVRNYVANRARELGVELVPNGVFSLSQMNDKRDYRVAFQNIPFCHAQVRALEFSNADEPYIIGSLPRFYQGQNLSSADWPDFSTALSTGINAMQERGLYSAKMGSSREEACIHVADGFLVPAWRFVLDHEGLEYELITTDFDVLQLDAKFFNVNGNARAYKKNPNFPSAGAPEIENVILTGLKGDGYLTNSVFTTSPVDASRVYDVNHDFTGIATTDIGFAEMNVFVHANYTLDWFETLGFTYDEEKELTLRVHYVFPGGDINNAVYSPSSDGPRILIADGGLDGGQVRLENLALDGDVVSHEFAHHVIYQNITTTSEGSESLVLHEGLSDAFTFLRTGDACLGESICPADSTFPCFERGACLRSAENDMRFTDEDLDPGAHIRGQFVSGMIWDLRQSGSIPTSALSSILVQALDLMLADSGYLHLIIAMLTVDRQLYNGQYGEFIYNAAAERGLSAFLTFNYNDADLPPIDETTGEPIGIEADRAAGTGSSANSSEGSKQKPLCGFIHVPVAGQWYILLLLLGAPLALVRLRRKP